MFNTTHSHSHIWQRTREWERAYVWRFVEFASIFDEKLFSFRFLLMLLPSHYYLFYVTHFFICRHPTIDLCFTDLQRVIECRLLWWLREYTSTVYIMLELSKCFSHVQQMHTYVTCVCHTFFFVFLPFFLLPISLQVILSHKHTNTSKSIMQVLAHTHKHVMVIEWKIYIN